jgi:hypothetical protein
LDSHPSLAEKVCGAHPTKVIRNSESGICNLGLFPLDGGGGFAGDVVDDAVDATDLVDDPDPDNPVIGRKSA